MVVIKLDGTDWREPMDFYRSLLAALGAPSWHGFGVAAVVDSMIWNDLNTLKPPFVVHVYCVGNAVPRIIDEIELLARCIASARSEHLKRKGVDVDAAVEVIRPLQ